MSTLEARFQLLRLSTIGNDVDSSAMKSLRMSSFPLKFHHGTFVYRLFYKARSIFSYHIIQHHFRPVFNASHSILGRSHSAIHPHTYLFANRVDAMALFKGKIISCSKGDLAMEGESVSPFTAATSRRTDVLTSEEGE